MEGIYDHDYVKNQNLRFLKMEGIYYNDYVKHIVITTDSTIL